MLSLLQAMYAIKLKASDRGAMLIFLSTVGKVNDVELCGVLRFFISLRLADAQGQFKAAEQVVSFLGRTSPLGPVVVLFCVCVCVCACVCV